MTVSNYKNENGMLSLHYLISDGWNYRKCLNRRFADIKQPKTKNCIYFLQKLWVPNPTLLAGRAGSYSPTYEIPEGQLKYWLGYIYTYTYRLG